MRNFDKIGMTTQTMVKASQESASAMWDYVARVQDLNTTLTQRAFATWLDGLRLQTELSQDVAKELFERAEEQADALQRLYGQWATTFFGFPFSGFPYSGGTALVPSRGRACASLRRLVSRRLPRASSGASRRRPAGKTASLSRTTMSSLSTRSSSSWGSLCRGARPGARLRAAQQEPRDPHS
jgi:hypothetical protein